MGEIYTDKNLIPRNQSAISNYRDNKKVNKMYKK